MNFLAAGFLVFMTLLGFAYLIVHSNPSTLARSIKIAGSLIAAGIGLFFAIQGRVAFSIAAFAFAYSILAGRGLGLPFGRFGFGSPPSGGQVSQVRSAALEMRLDHDSGDISGRILAGQFEGQELDDLDEADLQTFAGEVANDDESVALLEAYFDRRFPGWREHVEGDDGPRERSAPEPGTMTDDEAYQILGVAAGASEADIVSAHRRLMQKVHPDRGGSTFLAAKINEAKDRLLGKHGSTRTQN